jgi:hypothetical protein
VKKTLLSRQLRTNRKSAADCAADCAAVGMAVSVNALPSGELTSELLAVDDVDAGDEPTPRALRITPIGCVRGAVGTADVAV